MTSALARQTAIVLVDKLVERELETPEDLVNDWIEFIETGEPKRIPTIQIFPCFHANQGLKVVTAPNDDHLFDDSEFRFYSVVHASGYTVPESWTSSLPRAIAFCDQCVEQIPELTQPAVIFNQLPKSRKEQIKSTLIKIIQQLDQEFPEPEEE